MGKRTEQVRPYNDVFAKKQQVEQMFDNIAHKYDFLNHFLSLGVDNIWRKRAIDLLAKVKPGLVLDVATGTGDLAFAAAKKLSRVRINGVDISRGMLEIGKQKAIKKGLTDRIQFAVADSENLPFDDDTFDAITVAFGIRNFENLEKGLSEILRVLKPNGIFVILETSVPDKTPYRQGYMFYTKYILPNIGRLFSRDQSAYSYLSKSASVFPYGDALNNILSNIGFINVENKPQTFGVASIYTASKAYK